MNDMLNDDDIIARLRSALDEVAATGTADGGNDAATGDSFDGIVVPIRDAGLERRSRRTWLSVAAASAVLLGAGGWALSLRSSAPTGVQATTPSLETTTPGDVTSTASTYDPSYPWFELRLPDAEADGIVTDSTSGPSDTGTQVWLVTKPGGGGRNRGLLSVEVHYNRLDLLPDMTGYTEVSGAPQGTAWLRNDLSAGAAGPQLVWQRDDAVWWVTEVGLIDPAAGGGAAFANSVFLIEKGTFNDLLNNPDPQSEWWGSLSSNTRTTHTEAYTIGGTPRGAVLSVTNTAVLNTLAGFTDFTEVGVAGSRGLLGTLPDGTSAVVWPAAPTWWATLRINPALASRTSEILAAVTAANSVAPANAGATPTLPPTSPGAGAGTTNTFVLGAFGSSYTIGYDRSGASGWYVSADGPTVSAATVGKPAIIELDVSKSPSATDLPPEFSVGTGRTQLELVTTGDLAGRFFAWGGDEVSADAQSACAPTIIMKSHGSGGDERRLSFIEITRADACQRLLNNLPETTGGTG